MEGGKGVGGWGGISPKRGDGRARFVVTGFLDASYNCGIINPQEKWLH